MSYNIKQEEKDYNMNKEERMRVIAENITHYRKQSGITQKELADKIGIKASTLSDYINLRSAPSFGIIQKLADFFNVKKSDIDTTFKEDITSTLQSITDTSSKLTLPNQKKVLIYAKEILDKQMTTASDNIKYHQYNYYDHPISAGTGQYLSDVTVEEIELPVDYTADFVVPVYGDSMEPEYHNGDYVFIKLSVDLSDGAIGVFDLNGDAYIKELKITKKGAYLHSLNPNYKNIPITENDSFRVIGKVVGRYNEKD